MIDRRMLTITLDAVTIDEVRAALDAQRQRLVSIECINYQEQLGCEQVLVANLAIEVQLIELEEYGLKGNQDTGGTAV